MQVQNAVKYVHLHLLIILANKCFHVQSAVDVCHGYIGKIKMLMRIVSMFVHQIHLLHHF
jgi:hypothetical protein